MNPNSIQFNTNRKENSTTVPSQQSVNLPSAKIISPKFSALKQIPRSNTARSFYDSPGTVQQGGLFKCPLARSNQIEASAILKQEYEKNKFKTLGQMMDLVALRVGVNEGHRILLEDHGAQMPLEQIFRGSIA